MTEADRNGVWGGTLLYEITICRQKIFNVYLMVNYTIININLKTKYEARFPIN